MNQGRLIYKQSMDGFWVPVVNNKPLYSLSNTQKSCDDFCNRYIGEMNKTRNILFIGLGLTHHIDQLLQLSPSQSHLKKHCVLEINKKLIRDLPKMGPSKVNHYIFNFEHVIELFENEDFINYLLQKPLIAIHEESLEQGKKFYTELCQYPVSKTQREIFKELQETIAISLNITIPKYPQTKINNPINTR